MLRQSLSSLVKSCCDDTDESSRTPSLRVALVGNPNCGKTTLFNGLTGAKQHVGNWPGVTVERKSGYFTYQQTTVEVVDLPGVYSLTVAAEVGAVDERIACEFVFSQVADVIINIVDGSHLERHLYLTAQLVEMGVPMILAVNMMDTVRARGVRIDFTALTEAIGCPVVPLEAHKGKGIQVLQAAVLTLTQQPVVPKALTYPLELMNIVNALAAELTEAHVQHDNAERTWLAMRLLEDDVFVQRFLALEVKQRVQFYRTSFRQALGEDADIVLADSRYRWVQEVLEQCVDQSAITVSKWTTRLDNVVLHRIWGIPIFLGVMCLMFLFSINIGGAFQDFFDIGSETLFVSGLAAALHALQMPGWLVALLANGIGKGINTTVTFIPVIGAMFLFLALLEDSGYMARAAFVVDRAMCALGLPGKAFVPMIVGFGCNVPAVMGARTLEHKRDRILTIMMSPFMSCGARLAIFAVFAAAFFPSSGQNMVFTLYLIGIGMALLTGLVLRKTLLQGEPSPFVLELPSYHVPHVKTLLLHAWQRLQGFVVRAGRLIVPICMLIGALNAIQVDGSISMGEGNVNSLLSAFGRWVTPVFTPMGIHADNWPATVGLVTGILAKEVVVGSLNTLYSQIGHLTAIAPTDGFQLWAGLVEAARSIPENLSQLGGAVANPIAAQAPIHTLDQGVYGVMYRYFDGKIGAFAYLLFVLLYFPCISTTAAMLRELHRGWAIFSVCWMTGIAYGAAVFFYQAATWSRHPWPSSLWLGGVIAAFTATVWTIRWIAQRQFQTAKLFSPLPLAGEG